MGLLTPEVMDYAGPGLREICQTIGIPPVLHMGACVDNSRILTVLAQCATEGGLGEDLLLLLRKQIHQAFDSLQT